MKVFYILPEELVSKGVFFMMCIVVSELEQKPDWHCWDNSS